VAVRNPAELPSSVITSGQLETGEEVHIFQASPKRNLSISLGKAAAPDEAFGTAAKASRTTKILESAFTGDGADGLAALAGVTHAVAGSQAQAIGVFGGASTDGTYVGAASHADGIGGYFIGRSSAVSTRSGQGIFASGRRESAEGVAVGNETVCDNETETAGIYNKEGASSTRGIWLHPVGTADSGCGLQIGHTTAAAHWAVGIGVNKEAVTGQSFRDDSEALTSIQVNGTHSTASLAVAQGAGQVVIGALEAPEAGPLFVVYSGTSTIDPILDVGSGTSTSHSSRWRNASGQFKLFVCNAANQYLVGTVQGDTGINFTPGKTFHFGAQTKTSLVRLSEKAVGLAPATEQQVVIGAATPVSVTPLLELFGGVRNLDPILLVGSAESSAFSAQIHNVTGNAKWFVSNSTGGFLTGTVKGDTGFNFTPGQTFHIGAQTKTSIFRISEKAIGLFGVAPVERAAKYTQTYATAARTHAEPELSTTITVALVTELDTELNKTNKAVNELKKLINSLINDSRGIGITE